MTAFAGVLGYPIAHSRSPAMHNAAFRELKLDWRYFKLPVRPELFEETVRALPASGYRGVNVTIPHKLAALALADAATEAARGAGAANTLTFEPDGTIEADNTDAGGFLDALGESPRGRRVLVLGAGGAARAVAWALGEAGAAAVLVWNRTRERAVELAHELGVEAVPVPVAADIVVNTTSVGLAAGGASAGHDAARARDEAMSELRVASLAPPAVVVDLVYAPGTTPVVAWGQQVRARTVDGLEILVHQGARSFERWTGRQPPLETMRAAARLPRRRASS